MSKHSKYIINKYDIKQLLYYIQLSDLTFSQINISQQVSTVILLYINELL